MARQAKGQKAIDARINHVYLQRCSGIQVSVLDIGGIFKVGYASVAAGDNDATLGDKIAAHVATIRKN